MRVAAPDCYGESESRRTKRDPMENCLKGALGVSEMGQARRSFGGRGGILQYREVRVSRCRVHLRFRRWSLSPEELVPRVNVRGTCAEE